MKKRMIGMFAIVCMLFLVACSGATKGADSYIQKAELSKEEEEMENLVAESTNRYIYDYKIDSSIESMEINTYELVNGTWVSYTSSRDGVIKNQEKRRIALMFDRIPEGMRLVYQGGGVCQDMIEDTREIDSLDGMSYGISQLDDLTEIKSDQEIPLVLQYITSQNSIRSLDIEDFFNPEEIEKEKYDHVYAVSIRFSEKTLDELNMESDN